VALTFLAKEKGEEKEGRKKRERTSNSLGRKEKKKRQGKLRVTLAFVSSLFALSFFSFFYHHHWGTPILKTSPRAEARVILYIAFLIYCVSYILCNNVETIIIIFLTFDLAFNAPPISRNAIYQRRRNKTQ